MIPGSGRSPAGGNGNPFLDSYQDNPMHRGACQATVRGVPKSWTQLACRPRCQSFNTSPQLLLRALVLGASAGSLPAPSCLVPGEASCRWRCDCPHRTEGETAALMAEGLLRAIPRLSHDGETSSTPLFTFCHLYTLS